MTNYKERLTERLAELEKLNETSREARGVVTLDQSSVGRLTRMDAMQAQQMAAETARRRDQEMIRIRAALTRIENDDFGYCLRCDEEISPKRLDHDPSATLCIACANRR